MSFHVKIIFSLFLLSSSCISNSDKEKENNQESNKTKKVQTIQEISFRKGRALFNKNCLVCHNLDIHSEEKKIGPNLFGVTSKYSKEYLQKWIIHPEKLIMSGDKYAVQLYKKYGQFMPSFEALKQEQIDNIILYIDKESN
jgi:mono/diheme cytochrome c family protein